MPFKLPEEKVSQIVNIASYVNRHAFLSFFKIIKSIFSKKMPDVNESVDSFQVRKAYLPFWIYDMGMTANVKMTSENNSDNLEPERELLGIGFDCYWPGTNWNPMSYLCLSQSLLHNADKLVPFTPDLYSDMDDIEVIPFTVNPIHDLEDRAPQAIEGLQLKSHTHRSATYTLSDAKVRFNAVYPIYWPVYIAQFSDNNNQDDPRTIVISAHSEDPPIYQYDPTKPEGVEQWINNGPWIKLDVAEPAWQMGFGDNPVIQLVKRFATEAVGQYQTGEVHWDDARIQPYPAYQKQNKDYLQQLFKVWSQRNMLVRLEGMDQDQRAFGWGANKVKVQKVADIREGIKDGVAAELDKLASLEPLWFKDYKNSSSNKSF
ncbi:hypothetical protein K501DRAFT_259739 [Backusella circina FSU 941]|nr:hypothetical protein K501DRAFT_259739 [Backusella circina FSU 941]